jgi:uncharacterized membrane protein YeiH
VIRDILGGESPLILRKEIYVTAALAGAAAFVGLLALGVGGAIAAALGFAACFVTPHSEYSASGRTPCSGRRRDHGA